MYSILVKKMCHLHLLVTLAFVYSISATSIVPTAGGHSYVGWFNDNPTAMNDSFHSSSAMTPAACASYCGNTMYMGVENSKSESTV